MLREVPFAAALSQLIHTEDDWGSNSCCGHFLHVCHIHIVINNIPVSLHRSHHHVFDHHLRHSEPLCLVCRNNYCSCSGPVPKPKDIDFWHCLPGCHCECCAISVQALHHGHWSALRPQGLLPRVSCSQRLDSVVFNG